nr:TetR/AcrR family transcriptional regulator [uncultured Microbacterium sp.]
MARDAETNRLDRERAREKIIRAAVALFDEQGITGASVAQISQRAGVAQGLPNYYFGSKDKLISAIIERWFESEFATNDVPSEGDALIEELIDDTFLATGAALPLQRVVAAMKVQPHTHQLFAQVEKGFTGRMTHKEDGIREAFTERGAADPALEEIMLRTTLDGVISAEAAYGGSLPLEESRRWVYDQYDLPEPGEALPIDATPRGDDPRLRASLT